MTKGKISARFNRGHELVSRPNRKIEITETDAIALCIDELLNIGMIHA